MRADRFGSYSSVATFAGMASFVRLKSMMRYILRVPPPLCRTVMWPLKFRPECFLRTSIRLFSGSTLLRSEKSIVVTKRLPGLVGLYFFTGMFLLLEVIDAAQFDLLTGLERDDGFLEIFGMTVGPRTAASERLRLAADVDGIDLHDVHAE